MHLCGLYRKACDMKAIVRNKGPQTNLAFVAKSPKLEDVQNINKPICVSSIPQFLSICCRFGPGFFPDFTQLSVHFSKCPCELRQFGRPEGVQAQLSNRTLQQWNMGTLKRVRPVPMSKGIAAEILPCHPSFLLLPELHQIKGSVRISLSVTSPNHLILPSDSAMEAKAQLTRATPPQFSCLATFAATTRKRRNSTFRNFGSSCCPLVDKSTPSILNLNDLTHLASSLSLVCCIQPCKRPNDTCELLTGRAWATWYLWISVNCSCFIAVKSCASKAWLSLRNFSRMPRIKASDDTSALRWKGFVWVGSYCLWLWKNVVFYVYCLNNSSHPPVSTFNEGPTKAAFTSTRPKLVPWQRPRLHCQCPACANRLEDEAHNSWRDKRISSYLSSSINMCTCCEGLGKHKCCWRRSSSHCLWDGLILNSY